MNPLQQCASIEWNEEKGPGYYHMGIACQGFEEAVPGQFIMVRVFPGNTPLLRRPFSIYKRTAGGGKTLVEILYKVVGKGTALLSQSAAKGPLDIIGPLGTGFLLTPPPGPLYLAGGGIGVPPLFFLATTLRQRGIDMSLCRVFLGGRTQADLLCCHEFEKLGLKPVLTTDDGSAGQHCLITSPLESAVSQSPPAMLYACGPLPMLSCISDISKKYNIPCQISVETMMACGIGACLGCAVPTSKGSGGYFHACQHGPVFDVDKIRI